MKPYTLDSFSATLHYNKIQASARKQKRTKKAA